MPARPAVSDVLSGQPPRRIAEAVALMRALLAALPPEDGVAWFTRLYLAVTVNVEAQLGQARFRDPRFVTALDVAFANLFFDAIREHARDPVAMPRAWAPLVEARARRGVAPIQFALAGMNAHINRDLPVALVSTWRRLGLQPGRRSPQYSDFVRVNAILAKTEERVKAEFATGAFAAVDVALGSLDDVIAMWNVERAREAAWVNGETLRALGVLPPLRARFLATLDRMVGLAGRGLLRPIVV